MAPGHAVIWQTIDNIIFDQNDITNFIKFVKLHFTGQHVCNFKYMTLVRAIQQFHRQILGFGFDDQIDAYFAVVHNDDFSAAVKP